MITLIFDKSHTSQAFWAKIFLVYKTCQACKNVRKDLSCFACVTPRTNVFHYGPWIAAFRLCELCRGLPRSQQPVPGRGLVPRCPEITEQLYHACESLQVMRSPLWKRITNTLRLMRWVNCGELDDATCQYTKKSTRTRYEEYNRRKNGSQDYDKVLRAQRHLNDLDFCATLRLTYH